MDIKTLELFAAVARRGSFAAVAREVDVDPSSISRAISELEAELGLRLFQRTTRSMALTEAGDLYLGRVEPLMEELGHARDAASQISGAPHGLLRVTASVTFGQMRLLPLLPAFRARFPDLKIEFLFTDENVNLVSERMDVAIRLGPVVEGDLIAAKLMDTHYRVVASPSYLGAHPPLKVPLDLQRHRALLFTLRAYRTTWLFRNEEGREESVPIAGDITLAPAGSLLAAARLGLGPALLPNWLVDDVIAMGHLVDLFPHHRVTATTFETAAWLVYPSRSYLPSKVRVFADFLKESLPKGHFRL